MEAVIRLEEAEAAVGAKWSAVDGLEIVESVVGAAFATEIGVFGHVNCGSESFEGVIVGQIEEKRDNFPLGVGVGADGVVLAVQNESKIDFGGEMAGWEASMEARFEGVDDGAEKVGVLEEG